VSKNEVFKKTLSLISCLEKGHYESFFKNLEICGSILVKSVFCFPEILNTVRLRYMRNLRMLNNPDAFRGFTQPLFNSLGYGSS